MSSRNRVPGPAQILRQVLLHLGGGLEGHRVQVRIEFRQQAEAFGSGLRGVGDLRFYTYNVADAAISTALVLLILMAFWPSRRRPWIAG